jgi:hypothetical protein
VSFAAITLCIASQRLFIVVDFVIDSVRKILDTPSYVYARARMCVCVCVCVCIYIYIYSDETCNNTIVSAINGDVDQ